MKLRRFVLIVAAATMGSSGFAADQSGAEQHKKVVSARIVAPADAPSAPPKPKINAARERGNVQVTYGDGTKDLWTTKGNVSLVRFAADGTVGWTVHGTPVYINSGDPVLPNPELVVCRQGKILTKIEATLPFIEGWHFVEGGTQFALRCRGGHGPANVELHDTATGQLITTLKAYDEKLPAWARPLRDE